MKPYLTLHDPGQAAAHYAAGCWGADTFYSLLAGHAAASPDATALRDSQGRLSWAQLRARVDGMADALLDEGLTPGDRVSVWMSSRREAVITFLACSREGLACNPSLHRSYTCAEIVGLLDRLGSAVLVTEDGWGADRDKVDFDAALKDLPTLRRVFTPATYPAASDTLPQRTHDNPDTVAYLAFTSGTTGAPKCVMHSANTLLANARDLVRDWSIGPDSVMLTLSPLSHHIGWVAVAQWLLAGCQLVTEDLPAGASRLDWIVETGATYVMGVPTHAMDILDEQRARGLDRLGDVQIFYMAGSPIPASVAEAFVRQGITPQNIYGMTENSSHQYTHPDDTPQTWVATCGRGGGAYRVRVFDKDDPDQEVEPGEIGQIGGKGAALMLGYMDNQRATENSFNRDGWFLSGDLGSLDAAGNLRIEGRLKDLIIRGGHNIHPSRIEALALRHDRIQKAAAFAVADDRLGERVCLAIIGTLAAEDVLEHLASAGLSKFDMPEWFIAMDSFPLTASGKILKRDLQGMAADGRITPAKVRYTDRKERA